MCVCVCACVYKKKGRRRGRLLRDPTPPFKASLLSPQNLVSSQRQDEVEREGCFRVRACVCVAVCACVCGCVWLCVSDEQDLHEELSGCRLELFSLSHLTFHTLLRASHTQRVKRSTASDMESRARHTNTHTHTRGQKPADLIRDNQSKRHLQTRQDTVPRPPPRAHARALCRWQRAVRCPCTRVAALRVSPQERQRRVKEFDTRRDHAFVRRRLLPLCLCVLSGL